MKISAYEVTDMSVLGVGELVTEVGTGLQGTVVQYDETDPQLPYGVVFSSDPDWLSWCPRSELVRTSGVSQ